METITNNDAVVDCIVYANEVRMGDTPEGIKTQRTVIDPPLLSKGCSISMCGNDDDPECRLLCYCPNGHCLHDKCLEYMFAASESLSTVVCPQCRSEYMIDLVTKAKPIPTQIFEKMWCDDAVVAKSIRHFVPEINGISMLPMLITQQEKPH